MNPLLCQISRTLRKKNIDVRYQPVDYIPIEERRRAVECMYVHLHRLGTSLGLDVGRLPTIIASKDTPFDPADVLENVARLHADVVAMHMVLGTADIAADAFDEVCDSHIIPGFQPNFRAMVDECLEDHAEADARPDNE